MTRAETAFAAFDDLKPLGRTLDDADAMTLFTHLKDEMYFLPAFLAHYRGLGIERFVLVDDKSEDGSREYLLDQPDVMVLGTGIRFGDSRPLAPGHLRAKTERAKNAWYNLLPARFGLGRWAVKVDLDEFIPLPDGVDFRDLARRAEGSGGRAIYGAMIDIYPERLRLGDVPEAFDPHHGWYFDALQHLRPRGRRVPAQVYHGARARLLVEHGIWPHPALRALRRGLGMRRPPAFSLIFKAVFVKWEADTLQKDSHVVLTPSVPGAVLPIAHYKFAEDVRRRTQDALLGRQYALGSYHYEVLDRLLSELDRTNAKLTFEHSRPFEGYQPFAASGNATLPG